MQEIQEFIQLMDNFGSGIIIGLLGAYILIKTFFSSYLSEKGKNLATKEDVAELTDKVESVKTEYTKVIEEIKSNNQLKHAEIEREKNIRKEVYLNAVESITRYLSSIPSLSNLTINDQDISRQMSNDSAVIAKIQIVGSESTVKSITTLMGAVGATILELLLERYSLMERKKYIDFLDSLRTKYQSEIERYISMMENINLEGKYDTHLWDNVNKNVDFKTIQRDELQEKINDLLKIQNNEQLNFTKKCIDRYFEISLLIPTAVLSVRDDLGLPISSEAYSDIFHHNIEDGKCVLEVFYEKVSKIKA